MRSPGDQNDSVTTQDSDLGLVARSIKGESDSKPRMAKKLEKGRELVISILSDNDDDNVNTDYRAEMCQESAKYGPETTAGKTNHYNSGNESYGNNRDRNASVDRTSSEPLVSIETDVDRSSGEPSVSIDTDEDKSSNEPLVSIETDIDRISSEPLVSIETDIDRSSSEPLVSIDTDVDRSSSEPKVSIETDDCATGAISIKEELNDSASSNKSRPGRPRVPSITIMTDEEVDVAHYRSDSSAHGDGFHDAISNSVYDTWKPPPEHESTVSENSNCTVSENSNCGTFYSKCNGISTTSQVPVDVPEHSTPVSDLVTIASVKHEPVVESSTSSVETVSKLCKNNSDFVSVSQSSTFVKDDNHSMENATTMDEEETCGIVDKPLELKIVAPRHVTKEEIAKLHSNSHNVSDTNLNPQESVPHGNMVKEDVIKLEEDVVEEEVVELSDDEMNFVDSIAVNLGKSNPKHKQGPANVGLDNDVTLNSSQGDENQAHSDVVTEHTHLPLGELRALIKDQVNAAADTLHFNTAKEISHAKHTLDFTAAKETNTCTLDSNTAKKTAHAKPGVEKSKFKWESDKYLLGYMRKKHVSNHSSGGTGCLGTPNTSTIEHSQSRHQRNQKVDIARQKRVEEKSSNKSPSDAVSDQTNANEEIIVIDFEDGAERATKSKNPKPCSSKTAEIGNDAKAENQRNKTRETDGAKMTNDSLPKMNKTREGGGKMQIVIIDEKDDTVDDVIMLDFPALDSEQFDETKSKSNTANEEMVHSSVDFPVASGKVDEMRSKSNTPNEDEIVHSSVYFPAVGSEKVDEMKSKSNTENEDMLRNSVIDSVNNSNLHNEEIVHSSEIDSLKSSSASFTPVLNSDVSDTCTSKHSGPIPKPIKSNENDSDKSIAENDKEVKSTAHVDGSTRLSTLDEKLKSESHVNGTLNSNTAKKTPHGLDFNQANKTISRTKADDTLVCESETHKIGNNQENETEVIGEVSRVEPSVDCNSETANNSEIETDNDCKIENETDCKFEKETDGKMETENDCKTESEVTRAIKPSGVAFLQRQYSVADIFDDDDVCSSPEMNQDGPSIELCTSEQVWDNIEDDVVTESVEMLGKEDEFSEQTINEKAKTEVLDCKNESTVTDSIDTDSTHSGGFYAEMSIENAEVCDTSFKTSVGISMPETAGTETVVESSEADELLEVNSKTTLLDHGHTRVGNEAVKKPILGATSDTIVSNETVKEPIFGADNDTRVGNETVKKPIFWADTGARVGNETVKEPIIETNNDTIVGNEAVKEPISVANNDTYRDTEQQKTVGQDPIQRPCNTMLLNTESDRLLTVSKATGTSLNSQTDNGLEMSKVTDTSLNTDVDNLLETNKVPDMDISRNTGVDNVFTISKVTDIEKVSESHELEGENIEDSNNLDGDPNDDFDHTSDLDGHVGDDSGGHVSDDQCDIDSNIPFFDNELADTEDAIPTSEIQNKKATVTMDNEISDIEAVIPTSENAKPTVNVDNEISDTEAAMNKSENMKATVLATEVTESRETETVRLNNGKEKTRPVVDLKIIEKLKDPAVMSKFLRLKEAHMTQGLKHVGKQKEVKRATATVSARAQGMWSADENAGLIETYVEPEPIIYILDDDD